jgi:hypothetical protein
MGNKFITVWLNRREMFLKSKMKVQREWAGMIFNRKNKL